jgi:hypothetical protein
VKRVQEKCTRTTTLSLSPSSIDLREIIDDGLCFGIANRRMICLDHLRDLGRPERFAAMRRLSVDVVSRVACYTKSLNA